MGTPVGTPVPPPQGPLVGLHVIDLSRVYAGPSATQILADQGADVIEIEPPGGDETRDRGANRLWQRGAAGRHVGLRRGRAGLHRAGLEAIAARFEQAADDPEVRVIVLAATGNGAFCGGIDLKAVAGIRFPAPMRGLHGRLRGQVSHVSEKRET